MLISVLSDSNLWHQKFHKDKTHHQGKSTEIAYQKYLPLLIFLINKHEKIDSGGMILQ